MAAKSSVMDNDLLKFLYNAVPIANLGDDASVAPLTDLYVALHTADPTAAGDQSSSEAAYTGYARVAVARSSSGFTVTGNSVKPAAIISFPAGTGGTGVATHFSVGTDATGSGKIIHFGALSPTITLGNGVTPQLGTTTAITES